MLNALLDLQRLVPKRLSRSRILFEVIGDLLQALELAIQGR
jgi:hypothetical protein